MLAIGDRVEIMGRPGDLNRGKYGDIVHIDTGVEPSNRPAPVKLPRRDTEPSYSVKLNNGEVVHHLREQQLRKL
jgi:hypothetical protein